MAHGVTCFFSGPFLEFLIKTNVLCTYFNADDEDVDLFNDDQGFSNDFLDADGTSTKYGQYCS